MAHVVDDFDALKSYVGAHGNADDDFIDACYHEAVALVTSYVAGATVPAEVLNRAYLECGSELYHRRSAPNGISQFASMDGGQVMRVARDPLIGVYPITRPYVGFGIA